MIYLGIIAILLGIIAVFITVIYMKYTNRMLRQIKYIRNKCIANTNVDESKVINLFKKIQRESKLSIDEIYHIVLNYQHKKYKKSLRNETSHKEKEIVEEEIYNKDDNVIEEEFKNFEFSNKKKIFYKNIRSRGINIHKNLDINKLKKMLDINKVEELSNILTNYKSLFDRTFERIKTITDKDIGIQNSNRVMSTEKNNSLTCSKNLKNLKIPLEKLMFCQQNYNGKKYCFRVPKKSLCVNGKIVENIKKCDFY